MLLSKRTLMIIFPQNNFLLIIGIFAFTRLCLPFLHPTDFLQKPIGNSKALDTLVPLSHSEDTVSRR